MKERLTCPWEVQLRNCDADDQWNMLENELQSAIDDFVPRVVNGKPQRRHVDKT